MSYKDILVSFFYQIIQMRVNKLKNYSNSNMHKIDIITILYYTFIGGFIDENKNVWRMPK